MHNEISLHFLFVLNKNSLHFSICDASFSLKISICMRPFLKRGREKRQLISSSSPPNIYTYIQSGMMALLIKLKTKRKDTYTKTCLPL